MPQVSRMGQINCKWCGWVSGAVESLLGRRSFPSKRAAHKMSCLRCGCNIPSKTALPLELLRKVDEEMEKVSGKVEYAEGVGCWKVLPPESNWDRLIRSQVLYPLSYGSFWLFFHLLVTRLKGAGTWTLDIGIKPHQIRETVAIPTKGNLRSCDPNDQPLLIPEKDC